MLGPVWLTTALIMFGVMFVATRLGVFDSFIIEGVELGKKVQQKQKQEHLD